MIIPSNFSYLTLMVREGQCFEDIFMKNDLINYWRAVFRITLTTPGLSISGHPIGITNGKP